MADSIEMRDWLNKKDQGGSASVRLGLYLSDGYADLEIRDCSRSIELSFCFQSHDEEERLAELDNCIHKARTLERYARRIRTELQGLRGEIDRG